MIPLVKIDIFQCGCNIWWYAGEIEPGKYTKIDQVYECEKHMKERYESI